MGCTVISANSFPVTFYIETAIENYVSIIEKQGYHPNFFSDNRVYNYSRVYNYCRVYNYRVYNYCRVYNYRVLLCIGHLTLLNFR